MFLVFKLYIYMLPWSTCKGRARYPINKILRMSIGATLKIYYLCSGQMNNPLFRLELKVLSRVS